MSGFKYEKRPDPHGQDTSHSSSWTSSNQSSNAGVPNQGYQPAQPAQPARKFTPSELQQLRKEIYERETYERQIKEARLRFNAKNPYISPDTIVHPGEELKEIRAEEAALKAQGDKKLIAQSIEFRDGYPHFDFKVPKSVEHAGGTVSSIAIKRTFRKILIKRLVELGVKEAAAIPADGVGIGELIQGALAIHTAWSLYKDWDEMWKEAATQTSAPTQTQIPQKSNSANSPAKQSTQVQPVNLGDVPVYGAPISIPSDFDKHQADFDRAYAQRQAQEEKQARTEQGRSDQRRSVNEFHNSKLWKVAYQDNLRSYLSWLAIHDPKWLNKMKGQANRAYGTMTDYGKDFSFNRVASTDTPEQLQKHIQALTMYRSDIRARELVEYSNLELNLSSIVGKEFNHRKLLSVRHNFDAVFAGKYDKTIAPDKVRLIESEADRVYRQETGTDKVDRSSELWKVLRNVQAVSIFRDLWATVQQPPVQATKTVTGQPLPRLGGFGEGGGRQGALRQETFPSGGYQLPPSGGFGEGGSIPPESLKPETFPLGKATPQPLGGFGEGVQPEFSNIFAAKAGEIPGVDIPFRKVNPKYPANQDVSQRARSLNIKNPNLDCSEIAEDLLKVANGKGRIIEVKPSKKDRTLTLYEFGESAKYEYHQVYTDGQYVYDPRLSHGPVPKGDWEIMMRSLNSESTFQYLK